MVLAGLFFYLAKKYAQDDTKGIQIKTESHKKDKNISTVTSDHAIETILSAPKQKNDMQKAKHLEEDDKQITMYEILTLDEAKLTTKVRKNIQPVASIRISNTITNELTPNNVILFSDIEGVDYPIRISDVKKHNDGSVTATGSYEDEGISYTTTITQSENESFITLSSAQGLYEIEAINGVGYIYRADEIRRTIQKHNFNDFIVLPIPKQPTSSR